MGRRWILGQPSRVRRAISLTCATGVVLLTMCAGSALAAQQIITSAGPINNIYLNNDLACQVTNVGDSVPEFFGGTNPGACGTFLASSGSVTGPSVPAGLSPSGGDYTPVSQTGVTGSGTASSPYAVTTIVYAFGTTATITETDSYVVGQQYYRTDITVRNNSSDNFNGVLYHAGDCYLQGSDSGYGWVDTANHGIYCTANVNNSPAGRIVGFQPITAGSNYVETFYATMWGDINGAQFPDTCDCTTFEDNAAGISWPVNLGGTGSATYSVLTAISPTGQTPASSATAPPAVSTGGVSAPGVTSATFTGQVNPNNSSTSAAFQYGLDPSYSGGGSVTYTNQITASPNPVGSDNTAHAVSASATGLVPNAVYHVRLVASNGAGTTFGPDQVFRTTKAGTPGRPVLGKSFNAVPVSGRVYIRLPGSPSTSLSGPIRTGPGFVPLTQTLQLPTGTQIDTRSGTIKVVTATGNRGSRSPKLQNGTFGGGIFNVKQARFGRNRGLVTLKLLYGLFSGAPTFGSCATAAESGAPIARVAVSGSVLATLRARSHGRYSTSGHYGSATSRGTAWTITDRCTSTLIKVQKDTVLVRNFVSNKTFLLHAGQHLLIKARRR